MPVGKSKKLWSDPNREGRDKGRQAERFCSKCGNTVQQSRILKSVNLCEFCVKELEKKRDGLSSCRACGKFAPEEIKEHQGYCKECVCSACGRPDPVYVRKTGICFRCAVTLGDFCRRCGKEASAQVKKNKGYCDECKQLGPIKRVIRHRFAPSAKVAETPTKRKPMVAKEQPGTKLKNFKTGFSRNPLKKQPTKH